MRVVGWGSWQDPWQLSTAGLGWQRAGGRPRVLGERGPGRMGRETQGQLCSLWPGLALGVAASPGKLSEEAFPDSH